MRTHIDWLTFTATPHYNDGTQEGYADALNGGLTALFGDVLANRVFGGDWERRERGRPPYTDAWELAGDRGLTIFASPTLTHFCIEISGRGCEYLICIDALNELLTKCHDRVTRIDIATDIETSVTPAEFVAISSHDRMRASGYQKSESGETCYVGSQKSDRYARVYRYADPHPRSNLLRIEAVFRRKYAKSVACACLDGGIDKVSASAGDAFGFRHTIWQPDTNDRADISIIAAERKMGKTIYWLVKSCAPAFKRLVEDGTIRDPQAFFSQYFMPHNSKQL